MSKPTKREGCVVSGLALAALLATAALAAEPGEPIAGDIDLTVKQQQGVPYVSGGVGDEEQDAMRGARGRFNLRVNLATTDGKSLGGGSIRIEDQQGRTVLDTPTSGPVLLANLPPGNYRVHAVAGDKTASQNATVPTTGQEEITLTWPGSADAAAGDAPEWRSIPQPPQ